MSASIRPRDLDEKARDAIGAPLAPAPPPPSSRRERKPKPKRSMLAELPILIGTALLLAFIIKTFLVQAFFIPSGSMIPTLEIGDRVLVEKLSYRFGEPERGDVIVFRRPGMPDEPFSIGGTVRSFLEGLGLAQPDAEIDLIKRVIGLPGDTVALVSGQVLVNGTPIPEPYAQPETRDFAPVIVPEGSYFVMGDNRMNSLDSRFSLGFIPEANIVGRAFVILWPPGSFDVRLDAEY